MCCRHIQHYDDDDVYWSSNCNIQTDRQKDNTSQSSNEQQHDTLQNGSLEDVMFGKSWRWLRGLISVAHKRDKEGKSMVINQTEGVSESGYFVYIILLHL